jgi:hypothetical protein
MKRKQPESDRTTKKRANAVTTPTTKTAQETSLTVNTGFVSENVTRHHLLGNAFFHLDPAHATLTPPDVLDRFRKAAEERVWRLEVHTSEEVFVAHLVPLDLLGAIGEGGKAAESRPPNPEAA